MNGDRFTLEVLASRSTSLDVRWLGQVRFPIPTVMIDRMVNLPGERDALSEHYSQLPIDDGDAKTNWHAVAGMLALPAGSQPFSLELPEISGDFRFAQRFLVPATATSKEDSDFWTVKFSDGQMLRLQTDSQGCWKVAKTGGGALQRQSVTVRPGWHTLRLQRTSGRLSLSLDHAGLFLGLASDNTISQVELTPSVHSIFVDQVTLTMRDQHSLELPAKQAADAIVGAGGEIWWGQTRSLGPDDATWSDGGLDWARSWKELRGVLFAEHHNAIAGRQLTGRIVTLQMQTLSDRLDLPGDRLTVLLGASRDGVIEVTHPLLGKLAIPSLAIQRLELQHAGTFQLLDGREIRLGQSTAGKEAPTPGGQFLIDQVPAIGIDFVAEFSGLEPSGPDTPPGSPTLKSLRAGRMVTELQINGRRIGDFNQRLSQWSLPGEFDRIRLRVPAEVLKRGRNTWSITQQPDNGPRRKFDECAVRNIGWESP